MRDWRDTKFEVLGSKLRKPRPSDLEPSSVPLFSRVSLLALAAGYHLSEALPLASSPLILLRI
jgi:hypothetical protein